MMVPLALVYMTLRVLGHVVPLMVVMVHFDVYSPRFPKKKYRKTVLREKKDVACQNLQHD